MPVGNTILRKRSSFFGWEFAWDQEALERADYAGKLRSNTVGSGGSPGRCQWKSDLNPSSSEKIQPALIVGRDSFIDLDEDLDLDEDADLQLRNDKERLSSLPPPLSPLPPLLLPSSTTRASSQLSQSLPPTPTKSQPTLLPSITGGFKKRSAPPALPPLTIPKPSMRLSSMKMGTVRNAFAGVGAKVSARMSVVSSASTRSSAGGGGGATARNTVASSVGIGMMDDIDGDFMDLRDPFAPPPPSKLVSAWGRLPIPPSPTLPLTPETSNGGIPLEIANRKKAHSYHGERRKHKKEKRERKGGGGGGIAAGGVFVETNSSLHHGYGLSAPCSAGEEDADFDVEEALLSQRLLRRLDSVSFEWD